jgi:hypothetical protein
MKDSNIKNKLLLHILIKGQRSDRVSVLLLYLVICQVENLRATAFTFKKYKKAPQAHVLGSRGMLSPLQGVNEGDSVPLTK